MARKSVKSISVDANIRCLRVYPVPDTTKLVQDLDTVGFKISREQAIKLSRALLTASQEWDEIDVTCFRRKQRVSDNTFPMTVTSSTTESPEK